MFVVIIFHQAESILVTPNYVLDFDLIPIRMSIAEAEKINGQSLKGKKSTLNPVNRDKTAMENNMKAIERRTILDNLLSVSILVTITVRSPRKISVMPSVIHSIFIIILLSNDMLPKSLTTFAVGKRCEMPQSRISVPAT